MNLFQQFLKLLPAAEQTEIGTVQATSGGYTTLVNLNGGVIKVKGDGVPVGQKAFYRGRELVGPAPDLPVYEVEV